MIVKISYVPFDPDKYAALVSILTRWVRRELEAMAREAEEKQANQE